MHLETPAVTLLAWFPSDIFVDYMYMLQMAPIANILLLL